MIGHADAKRVIDAIPWPEGAKPTLSQVCLGPDAYVAHLYQHRRKLAVTGQGPTPEGALRAALLLWVGPAPGLALDGEALTQAVLGASRLTN